MTTSWTRLALGCAFTVGAVVGCAPFWAAAELATRQVQCALAHKDLSNEQIILECLQNLGPDDVRNVLDIVGQERAAEKAAVAASQRASASACIGVEAGAK